VNLNTATEAELDTLPGIGPVLAAAIVEWRTQNGGFTSIEQLQEVSGIGPTTYADLAPLVRI
jgi:competence protein ComEA